jgi:S-adenosylmethionine:tRNA ribosyltransferase-isomerase
MSAAFPLPVRNEATTTPERRGIARDAVRLLVTDRTARTHHDAVFRDLPAFLARGDLLVVNDSATIPAALTARRRNGTALPLHLSNRIADSLWIAEPRAPSIAGETLSLGDGGSATLLAPVDAAHPRLWYVGLDVPNGVDALLARYGRPIRYRYLAEPLPLDAYQTIFARVPGSAEMPSAARPFSHAVVARLRASGIDLAAITLHTGVSSLERGERPFLERFTVSSTTAYAIAETRSRGGRVVAVGTTVVRALESAVANGAATPGDGWTDRIITREDAPRVVDALLTGFHEPEASHLDLLRAFLDDELLAEAYAHALESGYLWHEFGDVHLIV